MRRTFTMADLAAKSATRPTGYADAVMALAVEVEPGVYRLPDDAFLAVRRRFTPRRERVARAMRRWRIGPGDVIAWVIMAVTLGMVRPCAKCGSRRKRMNKAGWAGLWRMLPAWAASLARRAKA